MKRNPAQRRYVRRFLPMMGAYIVLLMLSGAMNGPHQTGALVVLLAVLPALPLVGAIGVMGLYLAEEKDEFLRAQLIKSMLLALGAFLASATIWGFLQLSHVIGSPPTFLAFPIWCFFFGISSGLVAWADRRAEPS